jgi:hypothetical protein
LQVAATNKMESAFRKWASIMQKERSAEDAKPSGKHILIYDVSLLKLYQS